VRLHLGYDHRSFTDDLNDRSTVSNLFTIGAQVQVTDKLDIAVKREQNLGAADPTYPTDDVQRQLQAQPWTKVFFTQRLASAAIVPIGDLSQTGFAFTSSRAKPRGSGNEVRQIHFDGFAVPTGERRQRNGQLRRHRIAEPLPISKELSLELGFERGFHLVGAGKSFNAATLGFGWTPTDSFRASARYEFRDRAGMGQMMTLGAAGRISEGVTTSRASKLRAPALMAGRAHR